MLQSATIQDGGNKKKNARYTRLLAYDVSAPAATRPALAAEYVVPLPLDSDAKTLGASEIAFVGGTLFLVLARDSNGAGGDATTSEYKCVPFFPGPFRSGRVSVGVCLWVCAVVLTAR